MKGKRSRWRTGMGAIAGIVLALLMSVATASAAGAAAGRLSASDRPGACAEGQLAVTLYLPGANAAAGTNYVPVNFKNISVRTCSLQGYPGVSEMRGGRQLGLAAYRVPGPTPVVVLGPGAFAHTTLEVSSVGNYPVAICDPAQGEKTRVYLPGATRAAIIRHGFEGCRLRDRPYLRVKPITPGEDLSGHV